MKQSPGHMLYNCNIKPAKVYQKTHFWQYKDKESLF